MPEPLFTLDRPKSENATSVILWLSCSDGRLKFFPGESIKPIEWDQDSQTTTNKGVKHRLGIIRHAIEKLEADLKIRDQPLTKETVRSTLNLALGKTVKNRNLLLPKMVEIINQMESGKILVERSQKRYSAGSIKTFHFTVSLLELFQPSITVESVSHETYKQFITWCHEKNYSTNYIGSQIKNWKSLGKRVGGNTIYDASFFKKISEEASDIYLSEEELTSIYRLKLTGDFKVCRDWFILDSYTGLRISDLILLENRNISKNQIVIGNKKTGEKVIIPIHPLVKSILSEHNGFPPKVSDVEMNLKIKMICEKANIDERVLHTITKGGKQKATYYKKWEMVSCHTARRSFITNLRKNGVPDTVVMKLTGIKSSLTLKKYDKLTQEEAAKIAAGLKFFK